MKRKISFVFALLMAFQFFGCSDPVVEEVTHSQPSDAPAALANARGPASTNGTYFPLFQLFHGKTNEECDAKVNTMITHFFSQSSADRIYYEVGSDMAYILDANNNDVRSEGMSYGMMITVQLDMKTEFDRLWKWAKTYMLNTSGEMSGYFKWQCKTDGTQIDGNPAPDGEEYFAMALYFAYNRWGGSAYKTDADAILNAMLNNSRPFFGSNNLVLFSPYTTSLTDPSYHLPLFYELYAKYGPSSQSSRWKDIAKASRQYLRNTAIKSAYGLVPDYSDFDGNPANLNSGDGHNEFRYDAWRTVMNITLDAVWYGDKYADYGNWPGGTVFQVDYLSKYLKFFNDQGISTYKGLYKVDGTSPSGYHSQGIVAMNAVGARLVYNFDLARAHANEFWNAPLPSGSSRYYDGCLYMLSMLFCTGNYNVIEPGNTFKGFNLAVINNQNYGTTSFKSKWSNKVLTITGTQNDAETKAQPDNASWTSQDWHIESVPNTQYFRLKNKYSGKYLNVQNQNENAKVVCYDLQPTWLSQQWIIEPVTGTTNQARLKNVWSGRYLTVENTSDYSPVLSKSYNASWTSQTWTMY